MSKRFPMYAVVDLCDNDFAPYVESSFFYMIDCLGLGQSVKATNKTRPQIEGALKELAIARCAARHWMRHGEPLPDGTREYLNKSIKLTLTDERPSHDQDGGSVVCAVHWGAVWRY